MRYCYRLKMMPSQKVVMLDLIQHPVFYNALIRLDSGFRQNDGIRPEKLFARASKMGVIEYEWDGVCCHRVTLCDNSDAEPGDNMVADWLGGFLNNVPLPLPPLVAAPSPFQQRLRKVLLAIPRGATRTYGDVARKMGSSPRAVGQALGANPVPLLVPCHRVVAATGWGGFAFGLAWKQRLLEMERGMRSEVNMQEREM